MLASAELQTCRHKKSQRVFDVRVSFSMQYIVALETFFFFHKNDKETKSKMPTFYVDLWNRSGQVK